MAHSPNQFSLLTLIAGITFIAVTCLVATLGVVGCVISIGIMKHVLVAGLCMWHQQSRVVKEG